MPHTNSLPIESSIFRAECGNDQTEAPARDGAQNLRHVPKCSGTLRLFAMDVRHQISLPDCRRHASVSFSHGLQVARAGSDFNGRPADNSPAPDDTLPRRTPWSLASNDFHAQLAASRPRLAFCCVFAQPAIL